MLMSAVCIGIYCSNANCMFFASIDIQLLVTIREKTDKKSNQLFW